MVSAYQLKKKSIDEIREIVSNGVDVMKAITEHDGQELYSYKSYMLTHAIELLSIIDDGYRINFDHVVEHLMGDEEITVIGVISSCLKVTNMYKYLKK